MAHGPHSLDPSARAGLALAAVSVGLSYQPNLLTRRSLDQGVITGMAALAGYAWASSAHSVLDRIGDRLAGKRARIVGDAALMLGAAGATRALAWREHEPPRRAMLRLFAGANVAAAAAGVVGRVLDQIPDRRARAVTTAATMVGIGAATYGLTRLRHQEVGALLLGAHRDDHGGELADDLDRTVNPLTATGIGLATSVALLGFSSAESKLVSLGGRIAAAALGGEAADYSTAGRVFAAGSTLALAYGALTLVDRKLGDAGQGMEPAHAAPPDIPEVTGSPQSGLPWSGQSREGRRWLSMVLRPDGIDAVMGETGAKQPIRIYASLSSADTEEGRARVLLDEIDRTRALERPYVALWSPTGSGYVNYVACETFEYLTRGDCASMAIEYSVLPSSLSLTQVKRGSHQTRMVFDGIEARLAQMEPSRRPTLLLFGESLGSQVSEEVFEGEGTLGPEGLGLSAALWIGTPEATVWRRQLWGERTVAEPPSVGPGAAYLPRWTGDWESLTPEERSQVKWLLLQNGDDPIPKFGFSLIWRRPDWLGPDDRRPPGSPRGTIWWPVTTFVATFMDLMNALLPTPGVFAEGGHDYRLDLPEAIRTVWRLEASDAQMASMNSALRRRELAWEVKRRWMAAQENSDPAKRAEAEQKVVGDVATWTRRPDVTREDVERIIAEDCQPR